MASERVSIHCPHCRRHTSLEPVKISFTAAYESFKIPAIWDGGVKGTWWMAICKYCRNTLLVRDTGAIVYPTPLPSPSDESIPEKIRKDSDEAKLSSSVSAWRACAVMARRAIQTAAMEKGASSGRLADQIDDLANRGVITADLKEWAHVVRWVGNDAAHPSSDDVTEDDAKAILDLAEQCLHVVFVTPALARKMRKRKGK